jgi:hypothetical protein
VCAKEKQALLARLKRLLEKLIRVEETADPSPLKGVRDDKSKKLDGTTEDRALIQTCPDTKLLVAS